MKNTCYIFIILLLLFAGCKSEQIEHKKDNIIGEWSKINEPYSDDFPSPPSPGRPFGFGLSEDKIEYFGGFNRVEKDSITGRRILKHYGNFTDYKIKNDSIFIVNPFEKNWIFKWKVEKLAKDTLILTNNDSTFTKYKRLNHDLDSIIPFDQIILSRSGCYGSCPIIDISINKNNEVYFQGEGYVVPLGFFKSNVENEVKNYIFNKFRKVNISDLSENYTASHTDDETITTTLAIDGKVIKTIHDYGREAPNELLWAYTSLENLYRELTLDSIPYDKPFYPKLHYYTFHKDSTVLRLEKSESFYLWTELHKAKISDEKFQTDYTIWFRGNYTYWGPDPNEKRKHNYEIDRIESNGQLFTFHFINHEPITYDLEYNFIDLNFTIDDFKKRTKYD